MRFSCQLDVLRNSFLKALRKHIINSALVHEGSQKFDELAQQNRVTLKWVPGHTGIEGNEEADKLANIGASTNFIGLEPYSGVSLGVIKHGKKQWLTNQFKNYWKKSTKAKEIILEPEKIRTKQILRLSKRHIRIINATYWTRNF